MNSDQIIAEVRQGEELSRRFKTDYFKDSFQYIVFLFSLDSEINIQTVRLLSYFRKKEKISSFLIVAYDPSLETIVNENSRSPYDFRLCSEEEAYYIGRYCTETPREIRKKEHIVINGSTDPEEYRYKDVLGQNGLTCADIVALSVLFLGKIPTDAELADSYQYYVPNFKRIDWEGMRELLPKYDRLAPPFPDNLKDEVMSLIDKYEIRKTDDIAIFSYTKTTHYIIQLLQGYNIVAVVDNDETKRGRSSGGVTVFHPDDLKRIDKNHSYKIIVPTRSYKRICEQLFYLGYELEKNLFVTYRDEGALEEKKDELEKWEIDVKEGCSIYSSIRQKYPKQIMYLCTYEGTGDAYLIGMYLLDRMKYDEVNECVLVVASKSAKKILELYDLQDRITETIVLNGREECDKLLYYTRGIGYKAANTAILNNDYGLMYLLYLSGHRGIDFNTLFQKMIFHADTKRQYGCLKQESSDELFINNNLKMGKTVVLSPYANTPEEVVTDKIWVEIAERLKEEGYDVCTNVAGKEEPISGTKGIFIPYDRLLDFINKAGFFIGVRSGLCDIISSSTANKVILFPDVRFMYNTYFAYFSLVKMYGENEAIHEIIVKKNEDDIVYRVLESLRGAYQYV